MKGSEYEISPHNLLRNKMNFVFTPSSKLNLQKKQKGSNCKTTNLGEIKALPLSPSVSHSKTPITQPRASP